MTLSLRHEGRQFNGGTQISFGVATRDGLALEERISGPGELLYVLYASTHGHAMQAHYDRQGWGDYKLMPGVTDQPYERSQLEQQLADYPDDAELRRLNDLRD